MRPSIARKLVAALVLFVAPAAAGAQSSMTVSGYVTSRGAPLQKAVVKAADLSIERTTDAAGRYSFVVPSTRVRGQQIQVVASMSDRRIRYAPKTQTLTLTGGAVSLDFDLVVVDPGQPVAQAS